MNDLLIGSHVSMSAPNYLLGSVEEALNYGCNTFMIYTGAPQNSIRTPIDKLKINEFWQSLSLNDIDLKNVFVHAPYIINIGSGDKKLNSISTHILENETNRTRAIKCKYLIVHPGNAIGISKEQAIVNIANAINKINENNRDIVICLETMSRKGNEVGGTFEELKQIINLIKDKTLIGVCLDTCHIHDAGYDVTNVDDLLKQFDKTIGLHYLKVIHLNDSKNKIGDKKDRHENIGYGNIPFKTFLEWVHHIKLNNIPKILETPWHQGHPLYKQEIEMLKTKKWNNPKNL